MATLSIVLRKQLNRVGMYPLCIRITKDRKSSFIHLGQFIKDTDWDEGKQRVKKSHPNSTWMNNFLLKSLSDANDKLLEFESQRNDHSAKTVRKRVQHSSGISFFKQADIYLEDLKKCGKYNCEVNAACRLEHFREFLKGEDIVFPDITVALLTRYRAYLKGTRKNKDKAIKERTIINHLIAIRSVFSQAIKAKIVDEKYYPFGKDKVALKFPESLKIGFSIEEVKILEDLQLESGSYMNHAKNIWLFAFYFAGMRVSDVLRLRWSDFQNDRLHYEMGKNSKGGSLKVPEKALRIIRQYEYQKRGKDDLVFPELKILDNLNDKYAVEKKISFAVTRLNKGLKKVAVQAKIEKPLTMHIARHTFGNISGEKIPIQMLQKLYRHSSITTTIGYQANFIHKDADDALDAVVSF